MSRDWMENVDKIKLYAKYLKDNNVCNLNRFHLSNICKLMSIHERKNKGVINNHKKLNLMFLKVHKYLIEINLSLTAVNYANGLLFFYTGDGKDIIDKRLNRYTSIENNEYSKKYKCGDDLAEQCSCNEDEKCGSSSGCENRSMMIECNDNCRHGLYCRNKAIQIGGEKITSIFVINNEELGLRSGTNIEAGSFIIEYVGEVIDRDEFNRRKLKMTHNEPFYFFKLSHQFYIDAKWKGNKSRFINHSCSPNAELSVFDVKGYMRAGFFATRNISLGEEITFSYGNSSNSLSTTKCFCGSPVCLKYIPFCF